MVSLIIPIYSNKFNKYFFNSILEQVDQDFQLIIFTNDFSKEFSSQIREIENSSNIKLSIVFTTKKLGFNEVIIRGLKLSIATHAMVLNYNESLLKSVVNDINNSLKQNENADIFEFKTSLRGFEKWVPLKRCNLKQNYSFKISEYPKVLAYSFPFISNKIFKVSLGKFISKKMPYIETSSHLSIEFLYMLLLNAKTYVYINKALCNVNILQEDIPNYMNFYKEWKNIKSKYELEQKMLQEIEYAQMFYIEIIMPILYTHKKLINILFLNSANNNILLKKIYDKNKRIRELNSNSFVTTNKYMLFNLLEAEYLNKSHPPNQWIRILKIFKE